MITDTGPPAQGDRTISELKGLEADMKNILVLIHDDAGQEARFQAALDVARAVDGHLTCLDVAMIHVMPGDGFGADGGVLMMEFEQELETENKKKLERRLAGEDVPWDWIDVTGYLEPCLEQAASLCDLIVVNRALDQFPVPNMERVTAGLIVKAHKPILAVPDSARGLRAGGNALVAWDGSPAASAALDRAVPLLRAAGSVTILEVDDGSIRLPGEEAAAYLSRHGVHATIVERKPAEGEDASDVILAEAKSGRFAYLVMGGFSHSRFREAILGGVTRRMLIESPLPLFLAH